jgi:hypothetical protein
MLAYARVTVRNTWASNAKVRCRYQPGQRRTSSWSKPTSPSAVYKRSSIAQRIPATRTSPTREVPAGAKQVEKASSPSERLRRTAASEPARPRWCS